MRGLPKQAEGAASTSSPLGLALAHGIALVMSTGALSAATPGEVTGLVFQADARTLSWNLEPLAQRYNLYRGYVRDLSAIFSGTPLEGEVPDTEYRDSAVPPRGHAFFYLVTATGTEGEGTRGWGLSVDGTARERPDSYPWPGLAIAGRWEGPRDWPVLGVHTAVLPTGKVLNWGIGENSGDGFVTPTNLWDPVTDEFEIIELQTNIFCAGHSALPDGRLLVTGGQIVSEQGPSYTFLFDPFAQAWELGPYMRKGRYYPTNVALGDGRAIIFAGLDEQEQVNPDVEVFAIVNGTPTIDLLPDASRSMEFYPRMHLLSSGKIAHVGPQASTLIFDPVAQSWTRIGQSSQRRGEGTSVLLPEGRDRILILGGITHGSVPDPSIVATPTAEILDLSTSSPTWRVTSPMRFGRMHFDAVILPDGKILAAGGGVRYNDGYAIYPSEIFDPATETWIMGPAQKSFRLYHSSATLLPDGRAMWVGSNDNFTAEFYSPGYLFRGPRPRISSAPASGTYGGRMRIDTPDADRITSVVLILSGATTHSFSMGQRHVSLPFSRGSGILEATLPANPNEAPPAYYLLFILDGAEVPSVASFVRIGPE